MATNYSPKIVTNGLVLCLDASDKKSYPGSGTTWFDRSVSKNNGTLVNGVGYDSDSGGSLTFDGIDDYVQFGTITTQTVCFWGRMAIGIPGFAALVASSVLGDGALRTQPAGTFSIPSNSEDYHFGFDSSFMINGVSNLPNNGSNGFVIPNGRTLYQDFYVGAIGPARGISTISHTFAGRLFKGRVYAVSLYNRQLTQAELTQNFNARKGRFGI